MNQLFSLSLFFLAFNGSRNAWNNHFSLGQYSKVLTVYMVNEKHISGYRCLRPCSGSMETGVTDNVINILEYKSVYCSEQLPAAHSLLALDFTRDLSKAKVLRSPVPPSFYSHQMLAHPFLFPSCACDCLSKVSLGSIRYDLHYHLKHLNQVTIKNLT